MPVLLHARVPDVVAPGTAAGSATPCPRGPSTLTCASGRATAKADGRTRRALCTCGEQPRGEFDELARS